MPFCWLLPTTIAGNSNLISKVQPSSKSLLLVFSQHGRWLSILNSRHRPARLRVRGLPFGVSAKDITRFFDGYKLATDSNDSVRILRLPDGRPSGEAVVYFGSADEARRAQRDLNMKFIGKRFLELMVDYEPTGSDRWIDVKPRSENIDRKRFVGDNR